MSEESIITDWNNCRKDEEYRAAVVAEERRQGSRYYTFPTRFTDHVTKCVYAAGWRGWKLARGEQDDLAMGR